MKLSLTFGLLTLLCASLQSSGVEPSSPQGAKKNYAELISQLVSSNKEATTRNDGRSSVKFPTDYDVEAQKRIKVTRQELHDNIEDALPYLVAALDDKRYCMTIDWAEGDGYYNESVGAICRDVIASQLEVYRDKIGFTGPQHWHQYSYPISTKWWEKRTSHRLADLQVEAIDWAIERRKSESQGAINEDRGNEVAEMQKRRAAIVKSGIPAKSRGMLRMTTRDR